MKWYISIVLLMLAIPTLCMSRTFAIKWVSSPNVDHYEVEISTDTNFTNPLIKTTVTTKMDLDTDELKKSVSIQDVFYVRIKAIFFTGQQPSYSPTREFRIQQIVPDLFTGANGDIYLPERFKLNFILDRSSSAEYRSLRLYYRLGRKGKNFQYQNDSFISYDAPDGKQEIFYYFADDKNRNRTKWQRVIVTLDREPPVITVSGKAINNGTFSIPIKPQEYLEIKAEDRYSGMSPKGYIMYSLDTQNTEDQRCYITYSGPVSIETLLNELELDNKVQHDVTVYIKAIDNVGNENISKIILQYNPSL